MQSLPDKPIELNLVRHIATEQGTRLLSNCWPERIPIHTVHVRLHSVVFLPCAGKESWYICLQHTQCGIRILLGADNGVMRFNIPFGTLHGLPRVEGPAESHFVQAQVRCVRILAMLRGLLDELPPH